MGTSIGPSPRTLCAAAGCLVLLAPLSCAAPAGPRFEKAWLEQVEELSESLANDLLALSVEARQRNLPAVGGYIAERVRAAQLPAVPGELQPVVKWVQRHDWGPRGGAERELSRQAFLAEFGALLDHFSVLEDVRFKVKGADFDPARPGESRAHLKSFIVGRDRQGRREWLKAEYDVEAVKEGQGPWLIRRFAVSSMESMVAEADLFSEVAFPAGVAASFPAFGEGANTGFVSHGVATADVDGDGLLDLAATGVEQNYLYLNQGDGRFRDVSAESHVAYAPPGSGALFLDYDNDSDPDLFFAAVGEQVLLENRFVPDGVVQFFDVSERAGVNRAAVGFSAAAADVNRDGLTDIYVACYNRYGTVMPNAWDRATNGTPNLLFLNRGDGTFQEAGAAWGVDDSRWSYAASFADLDEDGDQDLYVANDFGENAFYVNEGDRFVDRAARAGIVDPGFGMGVSWGDYDNDGDLDLHVTNMSSTAGNRILKRLYPEQKLGQSKLRKMAAGNNLYENLGDGTFRDMTDAVGGFPGGWAFGGGFFDFDNDGWEDLYTPNGFVSGKTMKDT